MRGQLRPVMYKVVSSHPDAPEAKTLIRGLSAKLAEITGNDGTSSFDPREAGQPGSCFLVLMQEDRPMGCGALRPLAQGVCELKRMYARYPGRGIGKRILKELERRAADLGYETIHLATPKVNRQAIRFYLKHGYEPQANYGRYRGREESICFKKDLSAALTRI
jgi:GNAT superfamily N-acetyltransferase